MMACARVGPTPGSDSSWVWLAVVRSTLPPTVASPAVPDPPEAGAAPPAREPVDGGGDPLRARAPRRVRPAPRARARGHGARHRTIRRVGRAGTLDTPLLPDLHRHLPTLQRTFQARL